jgi:hypothetical protein
MFTFSPGAGFSGAMLTKIPTEEAALALNGKKVPDIMITIIKNNKNLNLII